jgi:hemerythrin
MRKTSDVIWQDAQHQVLFEILELIRDSGATQEVLNKLRDYTENHFALEERYMAELDFPGRDAHVESHDRFRAEIDQLLGQGNAWDDQFREIVSTFLTEWLTRHVFGIDKELEAFIFRSEAR